MAVRLNDPGTKTVDVCVGPHVLQLSQDPTSGAHGSVVWDAGMALAAYFAHHPSTFSPDKVCYLFLHLALCHCVTVSLCHCVILSFCHCDILSFSLCHLVCVSVSRVCHSVILSFCRSVILCGTVALSFLFVLSLYSAFRTYCPSPTFTTPPTPLPPVSL